MLDTNPIKIPAMAESGEPDDRGEELTDAENDLQQRLRQLNLDYESDENNNDDLELIYASSTTSSEDGFHQHWHALNQDRPVNPSHFVHSGQESEDSDTDFPGLFETLQDGLYYFANIDEIEVHHDASVDPHDEVNDTSVIQEASELVPVQDFSASNSDESWDSLIDSGVGVNTIATAVLERAQMAARLLNLPDSDSSELEFASNESEGWIGPAEENNNINENNEIPQEYQDTKDTKDQGDVFFHPPLYIQRYNFVMDIFKRAEMEIGPLKTVVDLGCSETNFMKFFRNARLKTERLIGVDIDGDLLKSVAHQVSPLIADHLNPREWPFEIELFHGSVAVTDQRLYRAEGVCAIELIEHLHPEELNKFPQTVFGCIQPKVCVITTPNKEYNILFNNFDKEFRHADHKFEWTRLEFRNWVNTVLTDYPEYKVQFSGVGYPELQPNPEGPCSQIAVFKRQADAPYREKVGSEEYVSIAKYEYPQELRSADQRIHDEVYYISRKLAMERRNLEENQNYDSSDDIQRILVPLDDVLQFSSVSEMCEDKAKIQEVCSERGLVFVNEEIVHEFELCYPDSDECLVFGDHQFDYDDETSTFHDCPCNQQNDTEEEW